MRLVSLTGNPERVCCALTCVRLPHCCARRPGLRVKFIVSGQHHTLVVTEDGKLYAFGRPTYGRLGVLGVNVSSDDAVHEPRVRNKRRAQVLCYRPC